MIQRNKQIDYKFLLNYHCPKVSWKINPHPSNSDFLTHNQVFFSFLFFKKY